MFTSDFPVLGSPHPRYSNLQIWRWDPQTRRTHSICLFCLWDTPLRLVSPVLSIYLQIGWLYFYSNLKKNPSVYPYHFLLSIISWQRSRWLLFPNHYEQSSNSRVGHRVLQKTPKCGTLQSDDVCNFRFLSNLHIYYHGGCIPLHRHQPWTRVPFHPHSSSIYCQLFSWS